MGMLGMYDAHFYCDACQAFEQSEEVHTAAEARKQVKKIGWKFKKDGSILCQKCSIDKSAAVMPEDARNGSDWREYPRLASDFTEVID